MKKQVLLAALVLAGTVAFAQKKTTTSAVVAFDATTSLDALPKAENKTAIASLDTKSGAVAFEATMKNFAFSNPKIQEHFNQPNWLDSDKYPTATFVGKVTNPKAVNFGKDGSYTTEVEGDLTIHGVTNKVKAPATFVVSNGTITGKSEFSVKLADYKVDGPAVGAGKVAKDPKITVVADFK